MIRFYSFGTDLSHISTSTLHYSATDPFMYYSIPEVLDASINLKDVDYSDIIIRSRRNADSNLSSDPPQSQPRLNREEAGDDDDVAAGKVSRKTRVSFECHPSKLVEAMMDDLDLEFGDESVRLDDIISLFDSRCSLSRQ